MTEYSIEPSFRQRALDSLDLRRRQLDRSSDRASTGARPPVFHRLLALLRLSRQKLSDVPLLARFTGHLVVLTLALAVTVAGQIEWQMPEILLPRLGSVERSSAADVAVFRMPATTQQRQQTLLEWQTVPEQIGRTERPAVARTEPVLYKVRGGDNPYLIATRFGLQPESIVWANPKLEDNPNLLSIGQELVIPPTDGVLHTVESGDTLAGIADDYDVTVEDIVSYGPNNLTADSEIVEGQWVMVPGGEIPFVEQTSSPEQGQWSPAPQAYGGATGAFVWPVSGSVTQKPWSGHMALDIANRIGTPVTASDSGVVVFAGWSNTGYGYNIVVDHGNGFQTRYAHLSYYNVEPGQQVQQHQVIGKVGTTGHSTGPHLHFEVIYNGVRQNPYSYLK